MTGRPLNTKPRTVLCVDDQIENLQLLEAIIQHHGDRFYGAMSGQEAIGLALGVRPQLILMDVQMPGMDGFETCRQMRRLYALRDIPIAFLTARKSGPDVQEGVKAGGNDFLCKPFDPDKLVARIDHWAARPLVVA